MLTKKELRYKLKKLNCPVCGKTLEKISFHEDEIFEFWCDNCDITILIYDEKIEEREEE